MISLPRPNLMSALARALVFYHAGKIVSRGVGSAVGNLGYLLTGRGQPRGGQGKMTPAMQRAQALKGRFHDEAQKGFVGKTGKWFEWNPEKSDKPGTMKDVARRRARAEAPVKTTIEGMQYYFRILLQYPNANLFDRESRIGAKTVEEAEAILRNVVEAVQNPDILRELAKSHGDAIVREKFVQIVKQIESELTIAHSFEFKELLVQSLGEIALGSQNEMAQKAAQDAITRIINELNAGKLKAANMRFLIGAAAVRAAQEVNNALQQQQMMQMQGVS